jgi:hypothetical protein
MSIDFNTTNLDMTQIEAAIAAKANAVPGTPTLDQAAGRGVVVNKIK